MSSVFRFINLQEIFGEKLSDSYYIRQWFLANDIVPMQKTVHKSLGTPLAEILFDDIPNHLRILLGLQPPLRGSGEQLMVDPGDELIDSPKLKPVTTKDIQALTHLGILAAGDKIIEALEEEKQRAIEEAIDSNDHVWKWIVGEKCKKCAKHALKKERLIQKQDIENILYTFIDIHKRAIQGLEDFMSLKMGEQMEKFNAQLYSVTMEDKQKALEELREQLTAEFEETLLEEMDNLRTQFNTVMQFEQARFGYELHERSEALRHQLECRGMADVLYVACAERHRYLTRQAALEKEYNDKIDSLTLQINGDQHYTKDIEIKYANTLCVEQKLRDSMKDLCKQFKKLIAYHLNLPPTQLGFIPELESLFVDKFPHDMQCVEPPDQEENPPQECTSNLDKSNEGIASSISLAESLPPEKRPFVMYSDTKELERSQFVFGKLKSESSRINIKGKILKHTSTNTINTSSNCLKRQDTGSYSEKSYPYLKIVSNSAEISNERHPILKDSSFSSKHNATKSTEKLADESKRRSLRLECTDSKSQESEIKHRDSMTVMRISMAKYHHHSSTSLCIEKECPTQMCAIKKVFGFELPSYMNKIASANFNDLQKMTYDDFAMCTPEQLQCLTDKFSKSKKMVDSKNELSSLDMTVPPPFKYHTKNNTLDGHSAVSTATGNPMAENKSGLLVEESSTNQLTPLATSTFKVCGDKESFSYLQAGPQAHTLESVRKLFKKNSNLAKAVIK